MKGAATLAPAATPQSLASGGIDAPVPTARLLRAKSAPAGKVAEAGTLQSALAMRMTRSKPQGDVELRGPRNELPGVSLAGAIAADLPSAPAGLAPLSVQNASFGGSGLMTSHSTPAAAALDLGAVIDRLVEARQTATGGRVQMSVTHEDFGAVNVRIDQASGTGLAGVALTSLDPGFAPAVHAALADRGASERQPANGDTSKGGDQPQARGDGSAQNGQAHSQHAQAQGDSQHQGAGRGFRNELGDTHAQQARGSSDLSAADDHNLYA